MLLPVSPFPIRYPSQTRALPSEDQLVEFLLHIAPKEFLAAPPLKRVVPRVGGVHVEIVRGL